jgi:Flp pilus assembly protein TadG
MLPRPPGIATLRRALVTRLGRGIRAATSPRPRANPVGSFPRNDAGAIAITFALAFLVILVAVGMAIDYLRAVTMRTRLNAAADSAVLAGVVADPSMSVSARQAYVTEWFNAQANTFNGTSVALTVDVASPPPGGILTVSANYTANVPAIFAKILGVNYIPIGNIVAASRPTPVYMDIHIVLDLSESMALPATAADLSRMLAATKNSTPDDKSESVDGCAFACHASAYGENPTFYQVATSKGIKLRIDSMRSAVQSVLTAAQQQEGTMPLYRFALHSFRNTLTTLSPLTDNIAQSQVATEAIQLPQPILPLQGETYYDTTLPALKTQIGVSGDGSKANPKKLLFIVTDGVQDEKLNSNSHVTAPINPALCAAISGPPNNVQIAVIYTSYLPMPQNAEYQRLVVPIASQIAPNLNACASPGFYYEASDGPAIETGMMTLFAAAALTPRLTN